MKRVRVTNISGQSFGADLEDPTQWIADREAANDWGQPGEYTVEITDVTQEYSQKDFDDYSAQKIAEADAQVTTILGGITDRRAIATALFNLGVVVNPLGNFTQDQIDAAKIEVGKYFQIMAQIDSLFAQRDSDIAAYKASLGL